MKKYIVTVPYAVFVTLEIEAETEQAAIDLGIQESLISGYCGNGGTDKLIGVSGLNISIQAGDEPLEVEPFSITTEVLEEE